MSNWTKPDSHDALKQWLLIDQLTLFQAVMLIFGRDPSHKLTGRPQGYVPMEMAMKQAIERGDLSARRKIDPLAGGFYSLDFDETASVSPNELRAWLEKIGKRDAFFFLADPKDWPTSDTPSTPTSGEAIATRERTNMLRIIRALATMAKLPERGATNAVEKQIEELGFEGPKEATIRRVLKEAGEL